MWKALLCSLLVVMGGSPLPGQNLGGTIPSPFDAVEEPPSQKVSLKVQVWSQPGGALDAKELEAGLRAVVGKRLGLILVDQADADPEEVPLLEVGVREFQSEGENRLVGLDLHCTRLSERREQEPGAPKQGLHATFICGHPGKLPIRGSVEEEIIAALTRMLMVNRRGVREKTVAASAKIAGRVVDMDFSMIKVRLQPPAPRYPSLAKMAGITGMVVVEIVVGEDGYPLYASALSGPLPLQPAAVDYALRWVFEPAKLNGVPQKARFRLTMPFRLK